MPANGEGRANNRKATIEYLGKYLKRPPLGESRLQSYNGQSVVFKYLDHYTDTTQTVTLPVLDFLARLIAHIPDRYFRNIRYYGFLAQRVRSQFLPIVYQLLNPFHRRTIHTVYRTWRDMLKACFARDPLTCPLCGTQLVFARLYRLPNSPYPGKTPSPIGPMGWIIHPPIQLSRSPHRYESLF